MKKLYTLLLLTLLRAYGLHAQQVDSLGIKLNAVFANVDKSQVPTRLLTDYGLPLLPLTSFNGTLADSTRTNPTLFRALYASAYTSCIYGTNPLTSLPAYNAQVEAVEASSSTLIPIMVQRIDYASLRPDALTQNLLSVQNNQLYDVPGRSQSPYQSRTLFVAAPSREYASSSTVTVVLPRSLYVEYLATNPSAGLRSLEIDLANGNGYQPVRWDQHLTTSYTSAGTKRIKVRFTYQQTAQRGHALFLPVAYESQFDLMVPPPAAASQRSSGATARTNNLASLADDSVLFNAAPGQAAGKAYIYYSANRKGSKNLVKPLIVLEGYDKHFIAPHISPLNYSLDQFLTEINTSPNASAFDLRNALQNTGDYDIVFVDYANGTDDILLNAGLFEQVLNYVNTNKDPASTEQNVVMGMSMGGLIGRYKLAQLEKANPGSTHVRLLVLQDSPQRGANLPLGYAAAVQQLNNCFLRNISIKDINAYIKEGIALFNQPGTRQLLKYQALGPNDGDFFANTFIDGPYRQMINYVAPYQIVAVSQGSQCGVGLFPPYTELVRASASSFNGILGYIIQTYLPFVPGFGGEVVINALPAGSQSERVAGLYLYTQIRILRFIPVHVTLTRQNFSCPAGLLPLDGAAGSTEPFVGGPNVINNSSPGWLGPLFSYQYALRSRFSFVSPASALDIADFTLPALSAKYINNITSVSSTSTNGFIAQEQTNLFGGNDFNVPHLTFTARNSEWIFDQMQNNSAGATALTCSNECSALTITGPNQVCANAGATTFQVNTANATWHVDPSGYFTTASGTITPASNGQFTLTSSGMSGPATITVTSANGCDVATLSIHAGEFMDDGVYNVMNTGSSGTLVPDIYGSNPVDGPNVDIRILAPYNSGVTYSFSLASSPHSIYQYGYSTANLHFVTGSAGSYSAEVTVTKTSACGTATALYGFSYSYSGYRYASYPNPADDSFTVEQTDSTNSSPQRNLAARGLAGNSASSSVTSSSTAPSAPYTVRLYDNYGVQQLQQSTTTPTVQLSTSGLPTGLYLVHIIEASGTIVLRRHVQITH